MNPLISIIIPIYNSEKSLKDCITSIQNQTIKNIEIILVNDGSTDNSLSICLELASKDSRIKVINKSNGGVSSARNVGIQNARGEYLGFIDSDDIILTDFFENLYITEADLVMSGINTGTHKIHPPKKERIEKIHIPGTLNKHCTTTYMRSVCTSLFRRQIIHDNNLIFDESLVWGEDYLFLLNFISHCKHINFTPYCGYHYDLPTEIGKYRMNTQMLIKGIKRTEETILEIASKGHNNCLEALYYNRLWHFTTFRDYVVKQNWLHRLTTIKDYIYLGAWRLLPKSSFKFKCKCFIELIRPY